MRQSKNSKEVQGTGTAQELQEQFNIATKDFYNRIELNTIKEVWEQTIIAWIGSEECADFKGIERANIFHFNLELIKYFETIYSIFDNSKEEQIDFLIFKPFFEARDYKKSKEYLNEVFSSFLFSDESDEQSSRIQTILLNKDIKIYLKKTYSLFEMLNSKNVA